MELYLNNYDVKNEFAGTIMSSIFIWGRERFRFAIHTIIIDVINLAIHRNEGIRQKSIFKSLQINTGEH